MMLKRFIFYFFGLMILGLGVSLTIKANIGTGAWDALNVGLSQVSGWTVGTWVILVGLLLIFVNSFISKERPMMYSMLTPILIGFTIDFWIMVGLDDLQFNSILLRYILFFIGLFLIAVGVSFYLQANIAPNPVDQFMLSLNKRFGMSLMMAKTIGEVLALILAIFLNGPIGIGTIIITIIIGPIIQLFYGPVQLLYKKWKVV
ncbi:YitT family protein [Bacillus sp. FJAT-47783]|uniref:YczE/YyaS/YitT family protein n=1 Tax=Bacillus sp. FJAT-47783 TaxID=2922712 RepID=UPI001FAC8658|nr:YitT family protein [Bacillus sp. FJAT-47783]